MPRKGQRQVQRAIDALTTVRNIIDVLIPYLTSNRRRLSNRNLILWQLLDSIESAAGVAKDRLFPSGEVDYEPVC